MVSIDIEDLDVIARNNIDDSRTSEQDQQSFDDAEEEH